MAAGNSQKMREALERIDRIVWDKRRHTKEETEAHRLATEALSVPPRNCDVGTAEEQVSRWMRFCTPRSCTKCPVYQKSDGVNCHFVWLQMPYESEVK